MDCFLRLLRLFAANNPWGLMQGTSMTGHYGACLKIPHGIPETLIANLFNTAEKLSDDDRAAILAIATTALAPFPPKAETTAKVVK